MTPSWLPTSSHDRAHAVPDGAEPDCYRPPWRWVVVLAAGYVALAGTSFSPAFDRHAAPPGTSAAAAGRAHGVAVNGSVATTADVRSDTRHG